MSTTGIVLIVACLLVVAAAVVGILRLARRTPEE